MSGRWEIIFTPETGTSLIPVFSDIASKPLRKEVEDDILENSNTNILSGPSQSEGDDENVFENCDSLLFPRIQGGPVVCRQMPPSSPSKNLGKSHLFVFKFCH